MRKIGNGGPREATAGSRLVRAVVGLGLMAALLLSAAFGLAGQATAETAEEKERALAAYLREIEPVCAADARRNARILQGVRRQVAQGKTGIAARRFARATRAYTQTLRTILRTQRPAEYRETLNRWIRHLLLQRSYLAQITRALLRDDRFEAQRLSVILMRNANQANAVVTGLGFKHCIIRPSQFM